MSLLPTSTYASPGHPLYAAVGSGSGSQTLSQAGNTVSLSGGGGSVDIASTTLVAATGVKTTAMSYNGGLLSTSIVGDLFVERTEVGTPLNPQPLSVNGSLDVVIDPMGSVTLTNLGSVLPAGQNVLYIDPVLGTVGQGGAPASTWVGTATSDLNMAGYNINTASAIGIKSDTGVLEFKNSAGISKGSLSYSELDGDIHVFAEDKLDLTANNAVDITATNADITLATNTTDIYVNSARGLSMTGAATGVGITAGGGNVSATANAGNVTLTANQDAFGSGGDLIFSTNLGASITSLSGNIALSCGGVASLGGLETQITSGLNGLSVSSGASLNLSSADGSDITATSDANVIADASTEIQLKIGGITQARLAGGGNIGVGGSGSDGSVFLLKNDDSVYGALNYNSANDTLNVDNGGSGISVGATGITATSAGNINLTPAVGSEVSITNGALNMNSNPISNAITVNGATLAYDANANIKLGDAFTGDSPVGNNAIAIGSGSGNTGGGTGQQETAIAIGQDSGIESQGIGAIALGASSGGSIQGAYGVCVGANAGQSGQGTKSVAVGYLSGQNSQGVSSVAIGDSAGKTSQALGAVAIGERAGLLNQGANSIAIGKNAITAGTGVSAGTIVLNATGVALNPAQADSLYVKPVRAVQASNAYQISPMLYNATTSEVFYGTAFYSVVRVTAPTSIALNAGIRGRTYITTSTGAQTLTFTNTLTANDTGFYVTVKNGNAVGTGDITIAGATGNLIVHNPTATTSGGIVYLYWTGAALQAF